MFRQVVTEHMHKRLDKLVLHNECGLSVIRFALSLFACNVPSEL